MKYSTLDYTNEQLEELVFLSNWINFAQRFGGDTRPFEALREHTDERTLISHVLWKAFYKPHQIIGICFPKQAMARDFIVQLKRAYDTMPSYIRPGIYHTNSTRLEFDNSSRIFGASHPCHLRGMMLSFAAIHEMMPADELKEFEDTLYPSFAYSSNKTTIITFS